MFRIKSLGRVILASDMLHLICKICVFHIALRRMCQKRGIANLSEPGLQHQHAYSRMEPEVLLL